jgi:bifunctional ADP-heptose synthase (sugar kinase/adenylyltransferase)
MDPTKEYIDKIKNKFKFEQIFGYLEKLNKLNVLVIGDTIIDHYLFVSPKGRAIKDPILSVEYKNREVYAGGILATANHINDFVKKIKLVTLIGDHDSLLDFIKGSIRSNIELKTFIKENSPTTVKKRIVDFYRNNKLFKIEYINDEPISNDLTEEIINYLDEEIPKYDLVIVGDFGHGFINEGIRRKLEEKSKFLAVNVQSNSANMGYNYIRLYKKHNFVSMDEQELRLPLSRRFEEIDGVIKEAFALFKYDNFLITIGNKGSIFVNKGTTFEAPILTKSVKDTIGAGDAVFAITSLLVYLKPENELVPFIGNCVGGIAVNIMGNKEYITKDNLLNFVKKVYNN